MEPMFLPDVEKGDGAGPHGEMIRKMRSAGATIPQIFFNFAFKPEAGKHLSRFTQEVMRGASPLPPGIRELIAAYTSKENHCPY